MLFPKIPTGFIRFHWLIYFLWCEKGRHNAIFHFPLSQFSLIKKSMLSPNAHLLRVIHRFSCSFLLFFFTRKLFSCLCIRTHWADVGWKRKCAPFLFFRLPHSLVQKKSPRSDTSKSGRAFCFRSVNLQPPLNVEAKHKTL